MTSINQFKLPLFIMLASTIVCSSCSHEKEKWWILPPPWIAHDRVGPDAEKSQKLYKKHLAEATVYQPDVLFVGDSITANWESIGQTSWDKYFAPLKSYNLAIGGENTQATLWRFEHQALDNLNPRVVVLMIGTNNLFVDSAEDSLHGILAVIKALQTRLPKSKILLLSILPRGLTAPNTDLRLRINKTNMQLADLRWTNVQFLDITHTVLKADQSVDSQLIPDGVHPSDAGYDHMSPIVASALKKLLEEAN